MIVYVAICCRAAIRGGCPVETAYSMSDSYIQDIESAHTVNEVNTIAVSMFNDYVLTVWHVKQITQYSPLINRCVMLIRMHSFERYKLSDLAREVGYSPYYLSTRFKEETGRPSARPYANQRSSTRSSCSPTPRAASPALPTRWVSPIPVTLSPCSAGTPGARQNSGGSPIA